MLHKNKKYLWRHNNNVYDVTTGQRQDNGRGNDEVDLGDEEKRKHEQEIERVENKNDHGHTNLWEITPLHRYIWFVEGLLYIFVIIVSIFNLNDNVYYLKNVFKCDHNWTL